MVCLDTSVLVSIIRKDESIMERLKIESDRNSRVSTTVVSLCELYAGAYGSRQPQKELERVGNVISTLQILSLTERASRRYGELVNERILRQSPIGDFDLMISSIVMEYGESLATHNEKHFAIVPGLNVEVW